MTLRTLFRTLHPLCAIVAALSLLACSKTSSGVASEQISQAVAPPPTPARTSVPVGRFGLACRLYDDSGVKRSGPANYRVLDLGKSGVPSLNNEQSVLIARIEKHIDLKRLWFTFLTRRGAEPHQQLIVFDVATEPNSSAPCAYDPAGYQVLNLPGDFYYESGVQTWPTAFCCDKATPKPWLTKPD